MRIKVVCVALPAVTLIGMGVASCSSALTPVKPAVPATRSASSAAASGTPTASATASGAVAPSSASRVPAGYTRVGGPAQGISVAAPASWVAVNLAKETIENAAKRIATTGISASTLVQDMEALQKLHAVFVYDLESALDSPGHFARNLNAYCVVSGVTDAGAAGVPFLKSVSSAEFKRLGATHITQEDLEIGGVPGIDTSYRLSSPGTGPIYGSQLEVLPKPDKACFVTVTVGNGESAGNVLSVAAATARFP